MWQYHYFVAAERAAAWTREAQFDRIAREGSSPIRPSIGRRVRRSGAFVAARIARRLDECVARDAFAQLVGD